MATKYLDDNGILYLWSKIKALVAGVTGTLDYTDLSNKPKVNGIELSGNKTTADLGITIPTKVSNLTNDSGYQTSSQVSTAISSAIANVTQFDFKIVESLPATGKKGTIYLVSSSSGEGQDIYEEYIWIGSKYENLGSPIDLSGYVKTSDMTAVTNAELDTICV